MRDCASFLCRFFSASTWVSRVGPRRVRFGHCSTWPRQTKKWASELTISKRKRQQHSLHSSSSSKRHLHSCITHKGIFSLQFSPEEFSAPTSLHNQININKFEGFVTRECQRSSLFYISWDIFRRAYRFSIFLFSFARKSTCSSRSLYRTLESTIYCIPSQICTSTEPKAPCWQCKAKTGSVLRHCSWALLHFSFGYLCWTFAKLC